MGKGKEILQRVSRFIEPFKPKKTRSARDFPELLTLLSTDICYRAFGRFYSVPRGKSQIDEYRIFLESKIIRPEGILTVKYDEKVGQLTPEGNDMDHREKLALKSLATAWSRLNEIKKIHAPQSSIALFGPRGRMDKQTVNEMVEEAKKQDFNLPFLEFVK